MKSVVIVLQFGKPWAEEILGEITVLCYRFYATLVGLGATWYYRLELPGTMDNLGKKARRASFQFLEKVQFLLLCISASLCETDEKLRSLNSIRLHSVFL